MILQILFEKKLIVVGFNCFIPESLWLMLAWLQMSGPSPSWPARAERRSNSFHELVKVMSELSPSKLFVTARSPQRRGQTFQESHISDYLVTLDSRDREKEKMSRNILVTFSVLLSSLICCRAYEVLNSTQMQLEQDSGLKNYEEEEDGKVLPYRCVLVLSDKIILNSLKTPIISGHS